MLFGTIAKFLWILYCCIVTIVGKKGKENLEITNVGDLLENLKESNGDNAKTEPEMRSLSSYDVPFRDCSDVKYKHGQTSGVYIIQPPGASSPFSVYCDQNTFEGGWTVFQNRFNGSEDFYRNWHSYKNGFGSVDGEFWLGLQHIHLLSLFKVNELYIELTDSSNTPLYARYDSFYVDNEDNGFALSNLGRYHGNLTDSLSYHTGEKFSTYDKDQDQAKHNCASSREGAWWFKNCFQSHLNGKYYDKKRDENDYLLGIQWETYKGNYHSFKTTKMMMRPIEQCDQQKYLDVPQNILV